MHSVTGSKEWWQRTRLRLSACVRLMLAICAVLLVRHALGLLAMYARDCRHATHSATHVFMSPWGLPVVLWIRCVPNPKHIATTHCVKPQVVHLGQLAFHVHRHGRASGDAAAGEEAAAGTEHSSVASWCGVV